MPEIRIPVIGDAENVEVIELCVAPGDTVGPDDAILVIESDKASMEVPAGMAGTLEELLVGIGDPVEEGQLIARLGARESPAETAAEAQPGAGAGPEQTGPGVSPVDPVPQRAGETVSGKAGGGAGAGPEQTGPGVSPVDSVPQQAGESVSGKAGGKAGGKEVAGGEKEMSARDERVISVPGIGDAQDVVVIEVAVRPGDRVAADGLAVVVESDKATMEIPAGAAGVVTAVHVREGDPVVQGTRLFTLDAAGTAGEPTSTTAGDDGATLVPEPDRPDAGGRPGEESRADSNAGRPAGTQSGSQAGREPHRPSVPLAPARPPGSGIPEEHSPGARVYAGPATRRLARELGVALAEVNGTGARGRIVKDDVKLFVKQAMTSPGPVPERGGAAIPLLPTVDFARFGPVETVPLTRVRAAGARNLRASWLNVPHVTQHDEADVTELEAFRRSLRPEAADRGVNLTPLPFIVKACCHALKEFPTFNASLDAGAGNYVLKRYYNIGLAVDSDQGLLVPVLKNADRKGIWELSEEIARLAARVREKRVGMDDVQGGTFSISSLGNLGGTGFTPIVNAPEVAILGVARLVTKPVWDGSEFQPRSIMPLSLSYDHRAINGAEAGRFALRLASLLNDIRRLSL